MAYHTVLKTVILDLSICTDPHKKLTRSILGYPEFHGESFCVILLKNQPTTKKQTQAKTLPPW